jgi:hypothetical protein
LRQNSHSPQLSAIEKVALSPFFNLNTFGSLLWSIISTHASCPKTLLKTENFSDSSKRYFLYFIYLGVGSIRVPQTVCISDMHIVAALTLTNTSPSSNLGKLTFDSISNIGFSL